MSNWTSTTIKITGDSTQVAEYVSALVSYEDNEQKEIRKSTGHLCITRTSCTPIQSSINPVDIFSVNLHWSQLDDFSGTFDGINGFVQIKFGTKNYNPVDHLLAMTKDYQVKIEFHFWQERGLMGKGTMENGHALDYQQKWDGEP